MNTCKMRLKKSFMLLYNRWCREESSKHIKRMLNLKR